MRSLDQVKLTALMQRTQGSSNVAIGLIDGPVQLTHPLLESDRIKVLNNAGHCARAASVACAHGTFVAGILHARRGGAAPGICPGCTMIVRSIFPEREDGHAFPICEPEELATAVRDCVESGARVLNLSLGLLGATPGKERALVDSLGYAARRGVLVVAASGNQGVVGGSALTRHPNVLPVVAVDKSSRVIGVSNIGASIGRRGLAAPGDDVVSLSPDGGTRSFSGTSAATPFVTGAIALLWSLFPAFPAARIRMAVAGLSASRSSVVPPMLDVQTAWSALSQAS